MARILTMHILICATAVFTACNRKSPPSSVGSEVEAIADNGSIIRGHIAEQYGKLARVDTEDSYSIWTKATDLEPPATPFPTPQDPCGFAVNARVRAPWARAEKMYAGRIAEVHGKFAFVRFDDGDTTWRPCDTIREYQRNAN